MIDLDSLSSKTYKEYTAKFDIDPLVLSVRLKKSIEESSLRYRLEDSQLKALITGDDYNDASCIKDFYKRKVLMETLKNGHLSRYRKSLLSLLDNPKPEYTSQEIGLFVTLPYFYEEDILLDYFKENYNTESIKRVTPNLMKQNRKLEYISVSKRFMNKQLHKRYWFCNENKELCLVDLNTSSNSLINFFESYILKNKIIDLNCNAVAEFHPLPHYKLFDLSIA